MEGIDFLWVLKDDYLRLYSDKHLADIERKLKQIAMLWFPVFINLYNVKKY